MIELETRPETVPETPPRPKTPQETLLAAARYIEEHGWRQGAFGQPGYERCAMGALLSVSPLGTGIFGASMQLLDRATDGAVSYNDTPGRTEAEVIAALRKAATL